MLGSISMHLRNGAWY